MTFRNRPVATLNSFAVYTSSLPLHTGEPCSTLVINVRGALPSLKILQPPFERSTLFRGHFTFIVIQFREITMLCAELEFLFRTIVELTDSLFAPAPVPLSLQRPNSILNLRRCHVRFASH